MSIRITGLGAVGPGGMGAGPAAAAGWPGFGRLPSIPSTLTGPSGRRMDTYSRLGMAAVGLALADAGCEQWSENRPMGIVAATRFGCLETDAAYYQAVRAGGDTPPSPGLFSYTLPSVFLGDAAIRYGLTGPTYVVGQNDVMGLAGLGMAFDTLMAGEADQMLCGVVNPPVPPMVSMLPSLPVGAFFFLLDRTPGGEHTYGRLAHAGTEQLVFNGMRVTDLAMLARQCMATAR